jgi:cardiolipin synthase
MRLVRLEKIVPVLQRGLTGKADPSGDYKEPSGASKTSSGLKLNDSLAWLLRKELRTVPNMVTLSRIGASPFLAYAVAADMKMAALLGCMAFGVSDWLDGYLAQRLNQRTTLGTFLDPMADKVMIGALSAGLLHQGLLPWQLVLLIIGRDVALVVGSFALRSLERPQDADFFDTTDSATFTMNPSDISKVPSLSHI